MSEVRLGVIGCGGMAQNHMKHFENVAGLRFVAGADPVQANRDRVAQDYGIETYDDGYALINSGKVDAVFIGTPHYFHPPYAIAALDAGLHVLTEKPVAVTAKAAQEVNDAADRQPELTYGVMFQLRSQPFWQAAKRLIDSDEVGPLLRANWTITTWFRTQAYYDGGAWRATWKGEGGGVLLNQCPHNLDLYTWLIGKPARVQATVGLGKYHDIEVEDDVSALMEFDNGATGTFITNTAEVPGVNRFEIVGDHSTLILEPQQNRITQHRHDTPTSEKRLSATRQSRKGGIEEHVITPSAETVKAHQRIFQNFIDAILHGEPLISPGREGLDGLELGNAMLMSGIKREPIDLPMDRDAYDRLLTELIEQADARGGKASAGAGQSA